jgi:MFS family permease
LQVKVWAAATAFENRRSASKSEVQLMLATRLIEFAFGQGVCGPTSGRFGRKPVLLMALALFCAARLATAARMREGEPPHQVTR